MRHPVSMKIRKAVRNSITKDAQKASQKPLYLVALSGGADSLALASAVASEASRKGATFYAGAVIVEHGLQEATKKVAEDTAQLAREFGLDPVMIIPVSITEKGLGAEGDARAARYSAFEEAVEKTHARGVIIGHTMNDQAEQVLLGLARGSGARSVSGIAEQRDMYIRPMLEISRKETEESCREMGIDFWVDPHNSHEEYARVRVRKNLLPQMIEELGEDVVQNLARTAQIAREDSDAMDFIIDEKIESLVEISDNEYSFNVQELQRLPVAIRKRMFKKLAKNYMNADFMSTHCEAVNALIDEWNGQKPLNLPGGITVKRLKNSNGENRITFS